MRYVIAVARVTLAGKLLLAAFLCSVFVIVMAILTEFWAGAATLGFVAIGLAYILGFASFFAWPKDAAWIDELNAGGESDNKTEQNEHA